MSPHDVYLIVSPDPTIKPRGAEKAGGERYFYIKFGDGLGTTRYSTHNPSFKLAQNNNTSGSGTYGIPEVVHGEDSTRVGKFLQKGILKEVRLTQVKKPEWYDISPGTATIAELQAWLVNLINTFPTQRFDGDSRGTPEQNTWAWIQALVVEIRDRGFD